MAYYGRYPDDTPDRYQLNAGRLWASGVATALVAALVAIVGILIARGLFKAAVLAPTSHGVWGDTGTATYAFGSGVVALLATGLLHVLSLTVAQPRTFFRWIMALITLIGVIVPLTLTDNLAAKIATALINLAVGLTITVILDSVGAATRRPRTRTGDRTTTLYTGT